MSLSRSFARAALFLSTSVSLSALADTARVEELKREIEKIALENQSRLDNFQAVRALLEPLVDELGTNKAIGFDEEKRLKVGAWQQLWTDDADDLRANNGFQRVDRTKTYQVVFEDGVFYNVSEVRFPLGVASAFLRGSYKAREPFFLLEFTDLQLRFGGLGSGSLSATVRQVKEGRTPGLFRSPFEPRYPNGPIGARGDIRTVYIDDSLRVDIGRNAADGVEDLFVLKRVP